MDLLSFFKSGKSCLIFDDINIDVSLSESHVYETDVTKNPVEDGAPICDNIINKSPKINIKGLCSPIKIEYLGGIGSMSAKSFIQSKWQQLLNLRESKETLTLFTGLATYTDMIMTSLSTTRDISNANHLEFTATFEQIRTVPVSYTNISQAGIPKKKIVDKTNSSQKDAGGTKNKIKVEKQNSILHQLFFK